MSPVAKDHNMDLTAAYRRNYFFSLYLYLVLSDHPLFSNEIKIYHQTKNGYIIIIIIIIIIYNLASDTDKYLRLNFAHVESGYPFLVAAGEYCMNWRFHAYVAHMNLLHWSLGQLFILFLWRNMMERDHFEDLGVNGRIVLKWILDK